MLLSVSLHLPNSNLYKTRQRIFSFKFASKMEKRSKSITDGYLFNILSNQVLKCKCPHLKGKCQGSEWNDECRTDGSYIVQTFVLLFSICESESDYCMMRWARWQGVLVSSHVWYLVSTLANIRLALT